MEFLEYGTTLAVCDTTIGHIIKQLFNDLPSALDIIECTNLKYSRMRTNTSICGHTEKNSTPCIGNKTVTTTIQMHLFIELLNRIEEDEINSSQHSTEAASHPKIKLSNIPPVLIINEKAFELRGVFCYQQGLSRLRNSVGHYYAYGKRGPNNWELFDDTRKKTKPVKNSTVAPCEYLMYSI
ncbi:unnamed protein product [Macrosiphum euphorbiae]|uniref:USP domain-containing protein n=1 Tax=Macrosiphum euphorbiae TaxID=13131 RepID=A0AAV0WF25_9HEMI|nr:unnamed protein product [Macrosiphum euphorbiae]